MQLIQADSWQELMTQEATKDYWLPLLKFVQAQYQSTQCFPPQEQIFRAFELTALDKISVVLYWGKTLIMEWDKPMVWLSLCLRA